MAGLLWRAVAACSHSLATDLQHVAAVQQLARCSQLWGPSCSAISQQPRQLSTSASSSSTSASSSSTSASTAAAATAAPDPTTLSAAAADAVSSSQAQQQQDSQGLLSTLLINETSKGITASHIGLYYDFNQSLVPEAFKPFHQAFYSPRPAKLQRKGGCRNLQAEFDTTSSSSLMWRRSSQELAQVLSTGASGPQAAPWVHLQGPAGSGKSIAVVQMVEWARSNGWLALYIPSAVELTRGGFFYRRPDGTYDTIISAQHILKSVADSHEKQLQGLPLQLQESKDLLQSPAAAAAVGGAGSSSASSSERTLRDLVHTGLSTDDNGQLAVDCCLQLVKELAAVSAAVPVLLAIDDYNALYYRTDYGTTVNKVPAGKPAYQYRKELPVGKLNLARGFKLLERKDLQQCRVLVADSCSGGVPADVKVPNPQGSSYHMPRFSEVETAHVLFYYHERGLVPSPPTQQQVAAMKALTNGSGAELRRWSVKITQTDMGLL